MRTLRAGLLILFSCLALYPLYVEVVGSFMDMKTVLTTPPPLIPYGLELQNYAWVLSTFNLARWLWNSIVVCVCTMGLELAVALPAAYAIEVKRFRGHRVVWGAFLASMMLSGQLVLIPLYRLIRAFGLTTSMLGLILPFCLSTFAIFALRAYLKDFPREVLDAAEIDGAGEIRKLGSVVVPMCVPVLAALAAMGAVGVWNNFLWQSLIANTDRTRTLVVGVARVLWDTVFYHTKGAGAERENGVGFMDYGLLMAGAVVVFIPMGVAFVFTSRYVMKGLYAGREK